MRQRARVQRPVSRSERIVSILLLALLPLLAAAVYLKGQRFDPRLFALDPRLLEDPAALAARGPAVANTLPQEADPEIAPPSTAGGAAPEWSMPEALAREGWVREGGVETFVPDTLYQKVNGRAEEYLRRGFERLRFTSYGRAGQFLDVYLYDMGSEAQALAAFEAERPPRGGATARLGRSAYRVEASYFFCDGRYYVQVVASDTGRDLEDAGLAVAGSVAAAIARRGRRPRS